MKKGLKPRPDLSLEFPRKDGWIRVDSGKIGCELKNLKVLVRVIVAKRKISCDRMAKGKAKKTNPLKSVYF
jgi:hypothetical protein